MIPRSKPRALPLITVTVWQDDLRAVGDRFKFFAIFHGMRRLWESAGPQQRLTAIAFATSLAARGVERTNVRRADYEAALGTIAERSLTFGELFHAMLHLWQQVSERRRLELITDAVRPASPPAPGRSGQAAGVLDAPRRRSGMIRSA